MKSNGFILDTLILSEAQTFILYCTNIFTKYEH